MQVLTSRSIDEPLHWVEIPTPKLGPDGVRVAVRAVGVNPVDWKMRAGDMLGVVQRVVGPSGSLVTGVDFAGEVVEVGSAVKDVRVGDRVVGGTDFSRKQHGSYAREVCVRADQVALLPESVPFDVAGCLPVAAVTAATALFELGHLRGRPDAKALVLGASGGVGHFAVQLARAAGAVVVGVCSARNVAFVEALGGVPLDYGKGEVFAAAAKLGPFDVVVDTVGAATYPVAACQRLLKPGGVHVLVMPRAVDFWWVALPGPTVMVLGRPNRASLKPLVEQVASGALKVEIAERIPWDEAERAHAVSRAGKVVGKLVLV
ncbi:MAG: NAD(P)-dependent alcohol dehydrogenase [Myxococcales bacterium]|nr:NAD(P)-dependent alcohol dehydrogenase [Myxococcales bacterium]